MEELKHGSWKLITTQHGDYSNGFWTEVFLKCSVCGYERKHTCIIKERPNYCEACGAKMDGDGDGN
jgi:hypothetical protein